MKIRIEEDVLEGTGTEIMDQLRGRVFDPTEFPDTESYIWFLQSNVTPCHRAGLPGWPEGDVEQQAQTLSPNWQSRCSDDSWRTDAYGSNINPYGSNINPEPDRRSARPGPPEVGGAWRFWDSATELLGSAANRRTGTRSFATVLDLCYGTSKSMACLRT